MNIDIAGVAVLNALLLEFFLNFSRQLNFVHYRFPQRIECLPSPHVSSGRALSIWSSVVFAVKNSTPNQPTRPNDGPALEFGAGALKPPSDDNLEFSYIYFNWSVKKITGQ